MFKLVEPIACYIYFCWSLASEKLGEGKQRALVSFCSVTVSGFSLTERDARTIFVKNLPYNVTQDDLQEVFDSAVEIRLVSKDGNSKG